MLSDRRRIGVGAALDRIVDDAERAAPPGDAGVDPDREILSPAGGFPAAGGAAVARQPKAKGFAEERTADDVADTPAKRSASSLECEAAITGIAGWLPMNHGGNSTLA